jgi:hypothetical protein
MSCPCPKHPFGCYGHPNDCGCSEEEIVVLRKALELISRKQKMDAVAAVSMRAIARAALTPADSGAK